MDEQTKTLVESAEAREKAATRRPWTRKPGWNNGGIATSYFKIPGANDGSEVEMISEDAIFIVHAREDVPALCAKVREQDAEIERLRAALETEMSRDKSECPYSPTGYCGACDICEGMTNTAQGKRADELERRHMKERAAWIVYANARAALAACPRTLAHAYELASTEHAAARKALVAIGVPFDDLD